MILVPSGIPLPYVLLPESFDVVVMRCCLILTCIALDLLGSKYPLTWVHLQSAL